MQYTPVSRLSIRRVRDAATSMPSKVVATTTPFDNSSRIMHRTRCWVSQASKRCTLLLPRRKPAFHGGPPILNATAHLRALNESFARIVAACISLSRPPCMLITGMSQRLLAFRFDPMRKRFRHARCRKTPTKNKELRSGCDPAMRRLRNNQNTFLGRARHWTKKCMPLLGEHNRNKDPFVIMAALDSLLCAIGNASLSLLKGMLVGQGACKSLSQLYSGCMPRSIRLRCTSRAPGILLTITSTSNSHR